MNAEIKCLLNGGHRYDKRVEGCLCGAKITKEDGRKCQEVRGIDTSAFNVNDWIFLNEDGELTNENN